MELRALIGLMRFKGVVGGSGGGGLFEDLMIFLYRVFKAGKPPSSAHCDEQHNSSQNTIQIILFSPGPPPHMDAGGEVARLFKFAAMFLSTTVISTNI